jgi:hypothetical protein
MGEKCENTHAGAHFAGGMRSSCEHRAMPDMDSIENTSRKNKRRFRSLVKIRENPHGYGDV